MAARVIHLVLGLGLLSVQAEAQPQRKGPDKPAERFTVYLFADEGAPEAERSMPQVVREVAKAIRKRKNWLLVTSNREKAEVFVRLLGHRVREDYTTTLTKRGRFRLVSGPDGEIPIDYLDSNFISEQHYIQASVEVLGYSLLLAGHDGRQGGASLNGAAAALARKLEDFLSENHDYLARRRRVAGQTQLTAPSINWVPPTLQPPSAPPESASKVSTSEFEDYLRWVEDYRKGSSQRSVRAAWSLAPEKLQELGRLFLAGDRSVTELKAASLLHTECVFTAELEPGSWRNMDFHTELARRYAHAVATDSGQVDFLRRWYLAVGYRFYAALQAPEAIWLLSAGLSLFPNDVELACALAAVFEWRGALRQNQDSLRRAHSILRTLLETGAAPADLDLRLAHVLFRLGKLGEAEKHLGRALTQGDRHDSRVAAWLLKGEMESQKNHWSEALKAFRTAWETDPSCQASTVALASAYERQGQHDAAQALIQLWLEMPRPPGPDGWWKYLLGRSAEYWTIHRELYAELGG